MPPGLLAHSRVQEKPHGRSASAQAVLDLRSPATTAAGEGFALSADWGWVLVVAAASCLVVATAGRALESHNTFLALTILLGSRYPVLASGIGLVWIAGHALWALGVGRGTATQEGGFGRSISGSIVWLSQLGLILATLAAGLKIAGIVRF